MRMNDLARKREGMIETEKNEKREMEACAYDYIYVKR